MIREGIALAKFFPMWFSKEELEEGCRKIREEWSKWEYIIEAEEEKRRKCQNCDKRGDCDGLLLELILEGGKLYPSYRYCNVFEWERKMDLYDVILGIKQRERYREKTLENFQITEKNKDVKQRVLKYIREEEFKKSKGFIFIGPNGVGKTHLAVAIWREVLKRKIPGIFVSALELMSAFREKLEGEGDISFRESIEIVRRAPFLALDDVGVEKHTDFVLERLFEIYDYRYENRLSTITTTNLSLDELTNRIGERIVSRILGLSEEILLTGKDWRCVCQ